MLPPNTLPITAKELLPLKEQRIDLLVYYCFCGKWFKSLLGNTPFGLPEFYRIAAHDYRHYFGEVVDLKDYSYQQDAINVNVNFFDNKLIIHNSGQYFTIYNPNSEQGGSITSGTELKCKQWLIDHFTAIAAKDLPNYNLKFIFS
jgi:hypothetical protein